MRQKKLFLYWALLMSFMSVGVIIALNLGMLSKMYSSDKSYMTVVITVIFVLVSTLCGKLCWSISDHVNKSGKDKFLTETETRSNVGWFFARHCVTLGLLGTVIGLVIMSGNLDGLIISDQKAVQGMMAKMTTGLSTALQTTVAGLIAGSMISLQYFLLSQKIERMKNEVE